MNDRNHWSLTSSGTPANIVPGPTSHLVIDDRSSGSNFIVHMVGMNAVKSLECLNTSHDLHFTGDQYASFRCSENFILNSKTFYDANTPLVFSNTGANFHTVNFHGNVIQANVLFENANWNLQSIKVGDSYSLKINKGTYNINNTAVVTGDLDVTANAVIFLSLIHI